MLFRRKKYNDIAPEDILLDAVNIPGYSREQFEGIIERPISKSAIIFLVAVTALFGAALVSRVIWLQVVRGKELSARAQGNFIEKTFVDAPRGIIYDRNNIPLVNNTAFEDKSGITRYRREVIHPYAYSHVLGFVGEFSKEDIEKNGVNPGLHEIGKGGIEQFYNGILQGVPGELDMEIDAHGKTVSRGMLIPPKEGNNIRLTLNAKLQEKFYDLIDSTMKDHGYRGGAGVIFSIKDGSILAMVSVPSFDINKLTRGMSVDEANKLFNDKRAPFFNRVTSGIFAPGSIVKPYIALAALEENIIDPNKQLFSSGSISVPDPYHPGRETIFKDNKAHGYIDMERALAVSSNVYFYTVGGGYGDVKGLGIRRIKTWLSKFGLNSKTGIDLSGERAGLLPDPEWKESAHPDNPVWRIGDTYHTSIGQGDILVSVLEMARAVGAIASYGNLITPHLYENADIGVNGAVVADKRNFFVVREGMRKTTDQGGSAHGLSWLPFKIGAKTGTAQVNGKSRINAWFTGFAPYDDPKIGMVIVMESGPTNGVIIGGVFVASQTFKWIINNGGIDAVIH